MASDPSNRPGAYGPTHLERGAAAANAPLRPVTVMMSDDQMERLELFISHEIARQLDERFPPESGAPAQDTDPAVD